VFEAPDYVWRFSSYFCFLKKKLKQLSTPEDLFALAGIGFAGIAALWAYINLVEVTS
jgi:hypothetical protein